MCVVSPLQKKWAVTLSRVTLRVCLAVRLPAHLLFGEPQVLHDGACDSAFPYSLCGCLRI